MTNSNRYLQKRPMPTTWEQLLLVADSDFVSFILLRLGGVLGSTAIWLPAHSVEKYLKAWLLKNDPEFVPKNAGHNLKMLWDQARIEFPNDELFKEALFDAFIQELNMGNNAIELRYSYGIDSKDPIFTRMYTRVACRLRESILGRSEYLTRGPFGIAEGAFGGSTHFLENPEIETRRIVCAGVDRLLSWPGGAEDDFARL
ncbi:MAG: hypothetical protein GY926_23275 [bacterium]|nr:hypothetical protein [bacterium]